MSIFTGSGVALVTPFLHDKIDYDKVAELIEWHIAEKTDAIIVCGTTGESSTLSKDEKKTLISFTVRQAAGRIPIIAGTGGNNTAEAIILSMYAEEAGADGLLLLTPYYNKATQNGLVAHFTAIVGAVNLPTILYNVPSRTGINMRPETVARLARYSNIVGIKEASGDISQIARVAHLCPKNFAIYAGNDDQIVPTLSLGGAGVISVVANILPRQTHEVVRLYLDGKISESLELQLAMLPLIDALFIEVNPIPVKAALNMMGMDVGHLRLPLTEMEVQNTAVLRREMEVWDLVTHA